MESPYDLERFLEAQHGTYQTALAELQQGRKRSHWIWFVFPQLKGLGTSPMAQRYGLSGLDEARAYLHHPILAPRLGACVTALLGHCDKRVSDMLGEVDALKLRSSLTLFAKADAENLAFSAALDHFYNGSRDARTLVILGLPAA